MKFLLVVLLFVVGSSCSNSGKEANQKTKTEKAPAKESEIVEQEMYSPEEDDYEEEEWIDIEDADFIKLLIDEEAKGHKKKEINYKEHLVSFPNSGDSYTVTFTIKAKEDLNNDSIPDYIVYRNSEGMLGGNINTNSSMFYYIMGPDNNINQTHEILISAPFSYNLIDRFSFKKNQFSARASQNYRAYYELEADELQSTNVTFVYKDSNVYEESYLSGCELAKWKNKQLLKGNSQVRRTIEMHNYTELVFEKLSTEAFDFSAEYSGCDNLNLLLEGSFKYKGNDPKFLKEKRNEFLEYLRLNSELTKEIEAIQKYFLNHEIKDKVELKGFSFSLFSTKEKGKTTFRLFLNQTKNPKQTENWEITTRS